MGFIHVPSDLLPLLKQLLQISGEFFAFVNDFLCVQREILLRPSISNCRSTDKFAEKGRYVSMFRFGVCGAMEQKSGLSKRGTIGILMTFSFLHVKLKMYVKCWTIKAHLFG